MHGRLFTLFDTIPFPSYFTLLVTGFVFATAMGAIWAKRIGQDPDVVVDLGLAMLMAGVIGGRLLHVLADGYFWDYVHLCTDPAAVGWQVTEAQCRSTSYDGLWDAAAGVCRPQATGTFWDALDRCTAWIQFWRAGFAFYGGFVLASITAWYVLKADRFPFWKAADMAGITVALGLGFGRMGCHLAGCCFGIESNKPWAIVFPGDSAASESQWKAGLLASPFEPSHAVHPTQLYESAGCLGIAAFLLLFLHGRKRYDGQVFLAFAALYAGLRFLIEFVRADDRGGLFGLSTSQLFGMAIVVAVAVVHRRLGARANVLVVREPAVE
ncbi:MAG: prolipoprotein diacylglyceryl transferase [Polyangiaceae bacterium]|nr:prolipoprotein diacylglyceryl transferase [Polyangiaceae bacterium]